MNPRLKFIVPAGLCLSAGTFISGPALAAADSPKEADLAALRAEIRSLKSVILERREMEETRGTGIGYGGRDTPLRPPQAMRAQAAGQPAAGSQSPTTAQNTQTSVAPQRRPGVLTPPGKVVVEPAMEFQHTDMNRFVAGGVAILDTVLIGVFEATQADRDSIMASVGVRTGVLDDLEVEFKVPYVYRSDRTTNTVVNTNAAGTTTESDGYGLGDIEFAAHYQLNRGAKEWPIFVGNLRVKTTTGTGPYDVERNNLGIEQEPATGSGFWGVEPSVSMLLPSDPAVFFANLGYLWNVKSSIDKQIGNQFVRSVDPGDAIRLGFGIGFALNERVSFTAGYQHDFILPTKATYANGEAETEALSVGALTFGMNYQVDSDFAVNLSISAGVTEDAPDIRILVRTPFSFIY